jgi:ABC-type multidrug transport system fused ATPase/permease subunit
MAGWRRWFALTLAWNVLAHLGTAVAGAGAAYAVAAAVRGAAPTQLWAPTVLVLAAVVVRSVAVWQESYTSHDLSFRVMARIRGWIFTALARIAPGGVANRRQGDLANITMNDSEALEVFLAHSSLYRIGRFLATPLILVGLAVIDPWIALACLPFLVLLILIPTLTRRSALEYGARARETLSAMASDIQEDAGAVREIVAFDLAPERRRRLEEMQDELLRAQTHTATRSGIEAGAAGVAASLLSVAATAVGVLEVGAGRLDLVWLPVAVALAGATTSPVQQWISTSRHTGNTAAAARRIEEVLEAPSPLGAATGGPGDVISEPGAGLAEPGAGLAVDARGVSFTWPGGHRKAVDEVTLRIPAGQTVALAGRSGSGKSTLAQLLARWYDPDHGSVTVGGADLREIDPSALREQVRLVPQDPHLFAESVRENLLLAIADRERADALSDAELWDALRVAGADDVVRKLPDGLDTILADHGRSLSGGERQRIALARAALHPSPVVILDESVSQLDTGTARRVQDALGEGERTTVVIAHRLVTLLHAERILVLEDGKVIGDGTHEDLLRTCPAYHALVAPQLGDQPETGPAGPPPADAIDPLPEEARTS